MVIEVVRAIIIGQNVFGSHPWRRKFGWKRPHRSKLFLILPFIEIKQPNLAKLCRLRTRINCVNFVKIVQGTRPLGAIILVKFHFFFSFGGRKPPPLNRSRSNLAGRSGPTVPSYVPNLTLIGATCRPCGAKNPKIGPWVNEIPAKLPAADPAGNNNNNNNSHVIRRTADDNVSACCMSTSARCRIARIDGYKHNNVDDKITRRILYTYWSSYMDLSCK